MVKRRDAYRWAPGEIVFTDPELQAENERRADREQEQDEPES